jgi:hypothetical protein
MKECFKSFRCTQPLKANGCTPPPVAKKHKTVSEHDAKVLDGEHVVSYKHHVAAMLSEFKKRSPNEELVEQLMKLTFKRRREGILSSLKTAEDILAEFPFLASSKHLLAEISFIMDQSVDTFAKEVATKWTSTVGNIFALGEKEMKSGNRKLLPLLKQLGHNDFLSVTSKGESLSLHMFVQLKREDNLGFLPIL